MPEELKKNEVASAESEKSRDVGVEAKPEKTKLEQAQEAKQTTFQKAEQARAAMETLNQLKMEIPAEQAASFETIFAAEKQANTDLERVNADLARVNADTQALESGAVVEAPIESATAVEAAPDAVGRTENDLAEFEKQNADALKEIAEIDPKAIAQSTVEGKMDMNAWRAKFDRLSKVQKEYGEKRSALIKARQEQAVTEYSSDSNDQIRKNIDRWGLQVVDRIIGNAESEGDPDIVALPDDLQWKDAIILHGKDGQTYVSHSMESNVKDRYKFQDRQQVLSELSAQLEESLKEREGLLDEMKRTPEARKKYDDLKALQGKINKINEDSAGEARGRADFSDKVREIEDLIREKRGIQGAGYRS